MLEDHYHRLVEFERLSSFMQRRVFFELLMLQAEIEKKPLTIGSFIGKTHIFNDLFKVSADQASQMFTRLFLSVIPNSIVTWSLLSALRPEGRFDRDDLITIQCAPSFIYNWAKELGYSGATDIESIPEDVLKKMHEALRRKIVWVGEQLIDYDYYD